MKTQAAAVEIEEGDGLMKSVLVDDRISQLPLPIMHRILCFLPQNDAVRTCVLSKSWCCVASTRPRFEFRESYFPGDKEAFRSALDKSLRRYYDKNLCLEDFDLNISRVDHESISLLEKWIPIVIMRMRAKKFSLSGSSACSGYLTEHFDFPSIVFESETLQELHLHECKLSKPRDVLFKHLKSLHLFLVFISDETLASIISSCPLITSLSLRYCCGLKIVEPTNDQLRNLTDFDFSGFLDGRDRVETNIPTVETFRAANVLVSIDLHAYFPFLTSLELNRVRLPAGKLLFNFISCNCPNLEDFTFKNCHRFEEFHLFSGSVKNMSLAMEGRVKDVSIDAPNIVKFEYEGDVPEKFSFIIADSSECKSFLILKPDVPEHRNSYSPWFVKLHEMVKPLGRPEISLYLPQHFGMVIYGGFNLNQTPVMVEHLHLSLGGCYLSFSNPDRIYDVFCVCRPRFVDWSRTFFEEQRTKKVDKEQELLVLFHCLNFLVMETKQAGSSWQQDLEEVSVEAFDENGEEEWHLIDIQWTGLSESALRNSINGRKIRLRLKWRDFLPESCVPRVLSYYTT